MSYGTIEAILDRDAWKQRAEAAESKLAAAEARLRSCEAEAEERRLERDVVEAAMAMSFEVADHSYAPVDRLHAACARLAAFRKEKGTRT